MVQPPPRPPVPIWLRRPQRLPIREKVVQTLGVVSSWFDVEVSVEHQVIVNNAIISATDPYVYPAWASELAIPVSQSVSQRARERTRAAGNEKSYGEHFFNALMEYPEEAGKFFAAAARTASNTVDSAGQWSEDRVREAVYEIVDYYLDSPDSPFRMLR